MSNIGFFTAITYSSQPKSTIQKLREKVDSYFYLGGRKAEVIPGAFKDKSQGIKWTDESPSTLSTCLKVISYFTIILPLILLLVKAILRARSDFYEVSEKKEEPKVDEKKHEYKPQEKPDPKIEVVVDPIQPQKQIPQDLKQTTLPPKQDQPQTAPETLNIPPKPNLEALEKIKNLNLKRDEIRKKVDELVSQKKYDDAFSLLNNEKNTFDAQDLNEMNKTVKIKKEGNEYIKWIEGDPDTALHRIQELENGFAKDEVVAEAIKKCAGLNHYKEAVRLLNETIFSSHYNKARATKAIAEGLQLENINDDQNQNAEKIAKFFMEKKEYTLATKISNRQLLNLMM